jgi:hypothetical protein
MHCEVLILRLFWGGVGRLPNFSFILLERPLADASSMVSLLLQLLLQLLLLY